MNVDLRALRHDKGLTLDQVCEVIEVPKTTLARIERTGLCPKPSTAKAIADFYDLTPTGIWPVPNRELAA